MKNPLPNVYGSLLVVRPPVPVTVNKAGANYKSEVTHQQYYPRRAFDEWVSVCEGIVACGGDALFEFEEVDAPFLGTDDSEFEITIDPDGTIRRTGSTEALGNLDQVLTGRVFTANGPWVVVDGKDIRAVLPNMLSHRQEENPYFRGLLEKIANSGAYDLTVEENPHRWEGMADVAVVGDRVVLTYAVPGHYDQGLEPKSERSCRAGVDFAADFAGVPADARVHAELIYPHFHGDTVHFGARPADRAPVLVHFRGGLWGDGADHLRDALGADRIVPIGRDDAVEQYAGNSRQVLGGVLVPDGVSSTFEGTLGGLGLHVHRVPLFELFGKAGGGPACATLYLPKNLEIPEDAPFRYSQSRERVVARRKQLPSKVTVDPGFFDGRRRG